MGEWVNERHGLKGNYEREERGEGKKGGKGVQSRLSEKLFYVVGL